MYSHRVLGLISGILFIFIGCADTRIEAPSRSAPPSDEPTPPAATAPDPVSYDLPDISNRYIVTFKRTMDDTRKRSKIASAGGRELRLYRIIPAAAVELPSAAADALRRDPDVLRVEPDGFAFASDFNWNPPMLPQIPQIPLFPTETIPWGLWRIRAPLAWEMTRGAGVKVAVLDSGGFNPEHPDFPLNYGGCVNFVEGTEPNDPEACLDVGMHSTHVTGTIAARENDRGVVGIAPEAEIWNTKVLGDGGWGLWSWVIAGVEWATENGMDVVNMSLGGGQDVEALRDACANAAAYGVIIVAAAGNSGYWGDFWNTMIYPARYDTVIAVAAIDANGAVADFSSVGSEMDFAAPGVHILSTIPDGWAEDGWSGTSMATPHVTGTIANMLAVNPSLTRECVYEILRLTASSPSNAYDQWNAHTGYGVVQAAAAVAVAMNPVVLSTVCGVSD